MTPFQKRWVGRKFKCIETGEILIIPDNVYQTQFFSFGNCFVDVGREGCYSRFGGNFEEVEREVK